MRTRCALLALALLSAACSGGGSTTTSLDPGHGPGSFDPVLAALDDRLGAGGEVDLPLAIDLFHAAFGVDLGGASGSVPPLHEGTLALGAILGHWPALTEQQRGLVESTVLSGTVAARWDPETGTTTELFDEGTAAGFFLASIRAAHQTLPHCGTVRGRCIVGEHTRRLIDETIGAIAERLGRSLRVPILFAFDPDLPYLATAAPVTSDGTRISYGDVPGACLITLAPPDRFDGPQEPTRENTLAHELFHCFQEQLPGFQATPFWLVEGQAEWVGTAIGGADGSTPGRWRGWLADPADDLFRRAYDGLGFYELLEQDGIDPWSRFDRMLTAGWTSGNAAAYEVAVGDRGASFAALIASSRVRQPGLGAEWDTRGTGVTADRKVDERSVSPAAPTTLGPYDPGVLGSVATLLTPSGDVLTLTGSASIAVVGFEGAPTVTMFDGVGGDWCLRPGGCTCPDGGSGIRPTLAGAPGIVGVAVGRLPSWSGGQPAIVATAHTLEDWCTTAEVAHPCDILGAADVSAVFPPERSSLRSSAATCQYPPVAGGVDVRGDLWFTLVRVADGLTEYAAVQAGATVSMTSRPIGAQSRVVVVGTSFQDVRVDVLMPDGMTILRLWGVATDPGQRPALQAGLETLAELAASRLTP